MRNALLAKDTISGQEGTAYAEIDGVNYNLFMVKKVEASLEKQKAEIRTLGKRSIQSKTTGWTGSGTISIYQVTPMFIKMAERFNRDGVETYFKLKVTNDDPTSSIGRQTVVLEDCNLDTIPLVTLDVDADSLEADLEFTFSDFQLLDAFKTPSYLSETETL